MLTFLQKTIWGGGTLLSLIQNRICLNIVYLSGQVFENGEGWQNITNMLKGSSSPPSLISSEPGS